MNLLIQNMGKILYYNEKSKISPKQVGGEREPESWFAATAQPSKTEQKPQYSNLTGVGKKRYYGFNELMVKGHPPKR